MKQLLEMAVKAGRSRQHPQTGLIHAHNPPAETGQDVSIPLLENILFALALFRTRTAEGVNEGKAILDRLLHFQDATGNFPVYLHEYPLCRDRYMGARLLPSLYHILQQFHNVLGQELKARTISAAEKALKDALRDAQEMPPPVAIAAKIGAAALAFGQSREAGEALLKSLPEARAEVYQAPALLGDLLASLQMAYGDVSVGPAAPYWELACASWHLPTASYAGPGRRESFSGPEPQVTLYDMIMAESSGAYSERLTKKEQLCHLQAAVLQPFPKGNYQTQPYAVALLDRKADWDPATDPQFHPFKLLWGNLSRVHSFVCQGGNAAHSQVTALSDHQWQIDFNLNPAYESDNRDKCREVAFYLDLFPEHSLKVNGEAATTFKMGDLVTIDSPMMKLSVRFEVLSGSGTFIGHLMQGNRPAQNTLKGENRFNAYDWQIFMRTIQRTPDCVVRATITAEAPDVKAAS